MKNYCFNYAVEGIKTFLPVFLCTQANNKITAYFRVKRYLQKKHAPRKVKVWFKNYPARENSKFV